MTATPDPAVTLLIPTWNAGPEFPEIFDLMQRQELDRSFETLIIDSGSSDGTVEFLRDKPGVRLLRIPHTEFNHGLTRNRGIEESRGEIVVLATQDARPADLQWMQWLVDLELGLSGKLAWWARVMPYAFSQNLGQFLGARSVDKLDAGSAAYAKLDRLLGKGV